MLTCMICFGRDTSVVKYYCSLQSCQQTVHKSCFDLYHKSEKKCLICRNIYYPKHQNVVEDVAFIISFFWIQTIIVISLFTIFGVSLVIVSKIVA